MQKWLVEMSLRGILFLFLMSLYFLTYLIEECVYVRYRWLHLLQENLFWYKAHVRLLLKYHFEI